MKVERSVFYVVEDTEPPAHYDFAAAEHVPSESEAGSKIIVLGIDKSAIGAPRIAAVRIPQARSETQLALLPWGRGRQNFVVNVLLRDVIVPAKPVVVESGERELSKYPARTSRRSRCGFRAGGLGNSAIVIVPEPTHKIGQIAASIGRFVISMSNLPSL